VDVFATLTVCCDLEFDLQNLIWSSLELLSFIKIAETIHEIPFIAMSVWTNEWTNNADGQPKDIVPLPTLSGDNGTKMMQKYNNCFL